MDRKGTWIIAGAIVMGMGVVAGTQAITQHDSPGHPNISTVPAATERVRFQVVSVKDGQIIILDVTTGELYTAQPKDFKPYDARPNADLGPRPRSV